MIEDKIKAFDLGQTLTANIGLMIDAIFLMLVLVLGLGIIESIPDWDTTLKIFALMMFLYLFLKLFSLRSRFAVVYTKKGGGYIRYD